MIFSIETFNNLITTMIPLAGIVIGVTNVLKVTFKIPARYIPLLALVLGAGLGVLFIDGYVLGSLVGVVVGLSSVGMWEIGTKTFNK